MDGHSITIRQIQKRDVNGENVLDTWFVFKPERVF